MEATRSGAYAEDGDVVDVGAEGCRGVDGSNMLRSLCRGRFKPRGPRYRRRQHRPEPMLRLEVWPILEPKVVEVSTEVTPSGAYNEAGGFVLRPSGAPRALSPGPSAAVLRHGPCPY